MKHAVALNPGDVLEAPYPFVRSTFMEWDEEGGCEVDTWKPGTRQQDREVPRGYEPDTEAVADAMGRIVLTIISLHKPGKYASRVFYTRRWRDPDGREFGKNGCRVTTVAAFRALARGYRHPFVLTAASQAQGQQNEGAES